MDKSSPINAKFIYKTKQPINEIQRRKIKLEAFDKDPKSYDTSRAGDTRYTKGYESFEDLSKIHNAVEPERLEKSLENTNEK